jgi:hypothetical protein
MLKIYVPEKGKLTIQQLRETIDVDISFVESSRRGFDIRTNFEIYHPIDQVIKAKKIVIESRKKDIYIITHSALFLEALDTYAQDYKVKTEFYAWKDNEAIEIENKHLIPLYKILGDPYDVIDEVKGKLWAQDEMGKR